MADVNLSKAVRTNLLSLQSTAAQMSKTQNRLATGLKVNSALDNPSNFFTASALNSRAGDMANLLDSMASGVKTIEAADNGLKSITKTVESMQSTLRQARQDKSFKTASVTVDAATVGTTGTKTLTFTGGALETAQTINLHKAAQTGNNGFTGPAGTAGRSGSITLQATSLNNNAAVTVNFNKDDTAATTVDKINQAISGLGANGGGVSASVVDGQIKLSSLKNETITVAGTNEEYIGFSAGSVANVDATLTAAGGTNFTTGTTAVGASGAGTVTLTAENGASISLNTTSASTAAEVTTGLTGNGFTVTGVAGGFSIVRDDGSQVTATFSSTAMGTAFGHGAVTSKTSTDGIIGSGTVTSITTNTEVKTVDELVNQINNTAEFANRIRASNDNGKLRFENQSTASLTVGGAGGGAVTGVSSGAAAATTKIDGNDVRANLAKQFNELRDQLDKFADDASFNGINLLRGDKLKLTFNETGTSTIEIQAKDKDNKATSIGNTSLGIETVKSSDFDSDAKLDDKLDVLKGALDSLRSQSSTFGSNLSVVENRQDFTKNMINTLETGAANLTLADTNEEAANLLALQTRQQLSSTALSMASQADQAVLRLF